MTAINSERAIGVWVKKWCSERGYKFIKLNPSTACGIPDRMILTNTGNVYFLELKSKGKTLREMQKYWRGWLENNKHRYMFIDCVNEETSAILENLVK